MKFKDSNINSKKGFTLVELIIYMGLFSIIMVVLMNLFSEIIQKESENSKVSSVESDSVYILNRLIYDVNLASSIDLPTTPGNQSGSLVLTIDGSNVTYSLSNGAVLRTDQVDISRMNSYRTNITSISFKKLGNIGGKQQIKVSYIVSSLQNSPSGYETKQIDTTIGLR